MWQLFSIVGSAEVESEDQAGKLDRSSLIFQGMCDIPVLHYLAMSPWRV